MQYNVYLYQNNYKQKTLYCTMIQKIYDSTANDGQQQRPRPHKCTYSTKAHKKYSVLYTRLLAQKRTILQRGLFFIFSSIRGANEPESTSTSHSTNANQCYRTLLPHHTYSTQPHTPHPIQNQTNLIPKPFLLIFTHFRPPLTTEIISTNSTSNSTRITFISFMFDGDSFYFCLLFHRIQPYLYPFIQTK